MDNDNILIKIFNYSWFIVALMPLFGGLGFIFAGWRVDETRWMDEGIVYMIPFILLSLAIFNMYIAYMIIIVWIIGIIRAIFILRSYKEKLVKKQEKMEINDNNQIFETYYKLNQFLENHDPDKNYKLHEKNVIENYNKITTRPVEINRASYEELLEIPSFNKELAQKVINLRKEGIYIESYEDLSNKLNLNNSQNENMEKQIIIDFKRDDGRKLDL